MEKFKKLIEKKDFPKTFGVYKFLDEYKNVLYVGKAENIYNRMKQYAAGHINSYKTHSLINQTDDIEFFITNSKANALILEDKWIKLYKPNFNILLKDDHTYPYIEINKNLDIKLAYKIANKRNFYFGPFVKKSDAWNLTRFLESKVKYENGLPINSLSPEEKNQKLEICKKILKLKNASFLKQILEEEALFVQQENYVRANELKQIRQALSDLQQQKESITLANNKDVDFIFVAQYQEFVFISLLFYRNGSLFSYKNLNLSLIFNLEETFIMFLKNYYKNNLIPDQIVLDNLWETLDFKSELSSLNITFSNNKKLDLIMQMAKDNNQFFVQERLKILQKEQQKENIVLEKLSQDLKVAKADKIMIIDNSHSNLQNIVTGVIFFINGVHQSKFNRFFNVSKNLKSDIDFMYESIKKYFSIKSFLKPDLIFVDGAQQQIKKAQQALKESNIYVPLFGIVKNKNHKTHYVLDQNLQKVENISQESFNFLSNMQIQVDEFAKIKHRNKNIKILTSSFLDQLNIDKKTQDKLLTYFKTYKKIKEATEEELKLFLNAQQIKKLKKYY
ncbi:GIY-YIG nuclease family protein [Mesomycoplasma hyorhinis]|uniref:GIY-YIG nuclease family protein n=1 Tax=Mesomycoplasma hyorhinis TaxID=2100 RepID=UPI001C0547D5|nr:GIY-YIG nuclease family protein [Mesomycoplasma hyorhinis]